MVQEQATPLTELLYNNAPPNGLDLAIIQDRSKAMTKRIDDLRNELKNLEEQLHLHKCVFSPARRIPTEVLTMIFDAVVVEFPFSLDDDWECDLESLATITLVCKRWRDVAYNSGHFWAVREVEIPTLTQKQCGTLLRWYGRSKGTPKTLKLDTPYSIRIKCDCYKQTGGTQLCSNAVLQRLLREGAPFSRISMEDFTPTCFKNIVRYIKTTNANGTTTSTAQDWWEKVQKLVLDFRHGRGNENDPYWLQSQPPAQSIFASFPDSLTSLALYLPVLEKNQRKFLDIPGAVLSKLITFSLKYPWGGPQFLTDLQHCTNVENLSLSLGDNMNSQSENLADQVNVTSLSHGSPIVLPKVKSLRLSIIGATAVAKHINLLRFPGLLELSIESEDDYGKPEPYSSILEAIGLFSPYAPQSFASLTVVGDIEAEDLYHLLGSITSPVTHLTTDASFDPCEFLKLAQGASAGTPNLLPSLQSLEVRDFPCEYHLDSLFLYIKSRQKHGKQKGKVVMKAPYDRLKWVMLEITWSRPDLKKAYYNESATLKILRESFGITVDRIYEPVG
ncbi:hypothetical protein DFP72DRAFT_1040942 [Ephemerocybe angulata]|uniref:F-box domain-containing protein n=1 Tax=Ephemerocybe angulata TaxID=980116 RepID=A0A8H6IFA1_9AGAR|nr:hypothetical protein DFP72DRAFT_1040942 [Tulosesus angulatus]